MGLTYTGNTASPVNRTRAELYETALSDLDSRAGAGGLLRLRRSALRYLTGALAGAASGLQAFSAWAVEQLLPDRARGDQLERLATLWGATRALSTPSDLRQRILGKMRGDRPAATDADWQAWVRAVQPLATGVWISREEFGPGHLTIRWTIAGEGTRIFPRAPSSEALKAALEPYRPVACHLEVMAPNPMPVQLVLQVYPNTLAVRQAVARELQALFVARRAPDTTILNWEIRDAISRAPGEEWHQVVEINADGTGLSDVYQDPTQVAYLEEIAWV